MKHSETKDVRLCCFSELQNQYVKVSDRELHWSHDAKLEISRGMKH